ncbi:hypothetical protein AC1031_011294 [Aphanomyces cochlioides]|nr:hypothetical protein AC1031_011294 [Aphanomyces cochlioides]
MESPSPEASRDSRPNYQEDPDVEEKPQFKRQKTSRQLEDSVHLSVLIASYRNHFNDYSRNHSNTTQLVPSKVWKKVYDEYALVYPNSPFTQETLKMRLRGELSALNTGTSNVGDGKASLQSDEVLSQLRMTHGHAKRNVLMERSNILNGKLGITMPPLLDCDKPDMANKQKLTKLEMLQKQVESMGALADSFRQQQEDRRQHTEAKLTTVKLENLAKLKDMGVISEEEFKDKALALIQ